MKYLRLFFVFVPLIIGLLLGSTAWWFGYGMSPDKNAEVVFFEVEQGATGNLIASKLEEQDLISSASLFSWFIRVVGDAQSFQAGYFSLQKGMSFSEISKSLKSADAREVQITIPEGYTLDQIGKLVMETFPATTKEDWDFYTSKDSPLKEKIANMPAGASLEGYLFPDTYRFKSTDGAEVIVTKLLLTAEKKWQEAGLPEEGKINGLTRNELIILASIVEREVRSQADMAKVAGLFYNRLNIDMALQADSTVNYVTGGTSPSITFDETRLDSPYNTYKYRGLTPGPISNPGLNALSAVVNPDNHDWLYFLSTPDGETIYAETFSQHVANKNKYLH